MHQWKKYATELLICFFLVLNNYVDAQKDIRKYYCEDYSQLVLIATVDGSLTAIEAKSGVQCWKTIINKDTFMSSSLSKFKVYENGERVWIVPSLDGNLFSYDGNYIAPLFMNVDSLLSTSATLDSKASIVGGKLKNFHGVNRRTGEIYYKCNMFGCDYSSPVQTDDILNIEEVSQTVNAFDFVGKKLSWHFRVGELAINAGNSGKISSDDLSWPSQSSTFLIGSDHEPSDVIKSIKISLHSGLVAMVNKKVKVSWMYQTLCPILDVWYVSRKNIYLMDPFDKDTEFFPNGDFDALSSSRLFLGTYKRQYFVKKSREPVLKSQYSTELSTKILHRTDIMIAMREAYMPYWNFTNSSMCFGDPDTVPAIFTGSVENVIASDDFSNEYGSYFYINQTVEENATHCIVHNYILHNKPSIDNYAWMLGSFSMIFMMSCIIFLFYWIHVKQEASKAETSTVDMKLAQNDVTPDKQSAEISEMKDKNYFSRFHEDFELLSVLGKGGFGVVMEVKNKIDDCHYAVKRIGVPDLMKNKDQQERVMREVRALAMLEHPGIVRYYNSWIENPPVGWQKGKDAEMNVWDVSSEVAQETSFLPVEKNKLSKKLKFNSLIGYQNGINSYDSLLRNDQELSDISSGGVYFRDSAPSLKHESGRISFNSSNHESGKHVEFSYIESLSDDSKTSSEAVKETVIENIDTSYLYIQMQLCKKENLSNWLKTNLTRNYNTVIVYFTQLVDAMEYVHKCGIMHRDLKPSNIYFSMDGTIKIGDFGLATSSYTPQNGRISDINKWSTHTRGCGTELYMSPEQSANKHYDSKTDIFSLGLILFELLEPFSTFSERYMVMMEVRCLHFPFEFIKQYPSESELLKTMLATDPSERPTALELKKHPLCWTYFSHEVD